MRHNPALQSSFASKEGRVIERDTLKRILDKPHFGCLHKRSREILVHLTTASVFRETRTRLARCLRSSWLSFAILPAHVIQSGNLNAHRLPPGLYPVEDTRSNRAPLWGDDRRLFGFRSWTLAHRLPRTKKAGEGNRTPNLLITNQLLFR